MSTASKYGMFNYTYPISCQAQTILTNTVTVLTSIYFQLGSFYLFAQNQQSKFLVFLSEHEQVKEWNNGGCWSHITQMLGREMPLDGQLSPRITGLKHWSLFPYLRPASFDELFVISFQIPPVNSPDETVLSAKEAFVHCPTWHTGFPLRVQGAGLSTEKHLFSVPASSQKTLRPTA